jgi:HAD superfamily hydrolase (TIGR01509 family)
MKRTAILFDMDGLMVDTEPLARRSWERVVATYSGTMSDDLYGRMVGLRTSESARLVHTELALPLPLEELIAHKTAAFLSYLEGGAPTMPGLWALLDRVEALSLRWAVATSTPRALAEIVLGKLGVVGRYDALAAGDEVAHGKPAPDLFLLAAERLGVAPTECLALEDSGPGCAAAAAAGARVIVVPTELTRRADFACAYRRYPSLTAVAADLEALLS